MVLSRENTRRFCNGVRNDKRTLVDFLSAASLAKAELIVTAYIRFRIQCLYLKY